MNKLANKLTVAALCVGSLVGLSACNCECTKKKAEPTEQTPAAPAPEASDVSTSVDAQGTTVEQVAVTAEETASVNQPMETAQK